MRVVRTALLRDCPAYVLLAIVIADSVSFADPDLWGHIRFGQAVIQAHGLITRDIYSYSAAGQPWHNHELGFELLIAVLYDALGIYGLKLFKLALSATTIILIAAAQSETGASLSIQRWVLMLTALGLSPSMQFRPQLVSFALTAAVILLLARSTYRPSASCLWPAIPIMALWANFHGGFVVGLGILTAYCCTTLFFCHGGKDFGYNAAKRLCLICACALATLLNPYGADIWRTVAHALSNPITRVAVGEWRPMPLRFLEQWHAASPVALVYLFAFVMMGVFLVVLTLTPRRDDMALVAVAGLMMASALYATRNMALAFIALSVPLTRHMALLEKQAPPCPGTGRAPTNADEQGDNGALTIWRAFFARVRTRAFERSRPKNSGRSTFSFANQAFVSVCALVLAFFDGLFSPSLRAAPAPYPAGAVRFMQQNSLRGNILCDFAWGEYLIWHTGPSSKVFIDGRYDTVYPQRVLRDYLSFYLSRPGAERVLAAYPHDFAIIPPAAQAYTLLRGQRGWKLIYQDSGAAIFARAGAANKLAPIDPSGAPVEPANAGFFP